MAENHPGLTGLGVVAILAISSALMDAQAKQPSADTLKMEARNFGKIISGDKRKSQTYCKIVKSMSRSTKRKIPERLES